MTSPGLSREAKSSESAKVTATRFGPTSEERFGGGPLSRVCMDMLSSVSYSFLTFDIDAPPIAALWLGDEGVRTPPCSRSTPRSEMVALSPTCRKAMPEVRARDFRWSRLRNHVECQMSCSGSRQRLLVPNYGTSAIITDHPRLLPHGACDTVWCECRLCSVRRRRVR